jgi:hypothetical protein
LQKKTLGRIALPTLRFFKDGEMTKELVGAEQCHKLPEVLEELETKRSSWYDIQLPWW